MPRAITKRCRGIAKTWVNICRHHAFPAISPFFIFGTRPDKLRTSLSSPTEPAGEARRGASPYFGGLGCGWPRSALAGPFWGLWWHF
jgi:hypothetical protein